MPKPETTASILSGIAWRRFIPILVWLIAVLVAAVLTYIHAPPAGMLAAKSLSSGHQVEIADLRNEATDALVGHFLKNDVKAHDVLDSAMVTVGRPPHSFDNSLAVRVETTAVSIERQKLVAGSAVILSREERQIGPPGKITEIDCDQRFCRIVVTFAKIDSLKVDLADLAAIELKPAPAVSPAPTPKNPCVEKGSTKTGAADGSHDASACK